MSEMVPTLMPLPDLFGDLEPVPGYAIDLTEWEFFDDHTAEEEQIITDIIRDAFKDEPPCMYFANNHRDEPKASDPATLRVALPLSRGMSLFDCSLEAVVDDAIDWFTSDVSGEGEAARWVITG